MNVSQQLGNQSVEFKRSYLKIIELNKSEMTISANRIVMALYGISCGCLVSSINKVSGPLKIDTVLDMGGFVDLGFDKNLKDITILIRSNIEQIIDLMEYAEIKGRKNSVSKLGLELANAIDQGNNRLHSMIKNAAQQSDAPEPASPAR
jgi:hypothetical protein